MLNIQRKGRKEGALCRSIVREKVSDVNSWRDIKFVVFDAHDRKYFHSVQIYEVTVMLQRNEL
jgi:hypothetical protein